MGTYTTKYNLYKPDSGETGIAVQLNENIDKIENAMQDMSGSLNSNSIGYISLATRISNLEMLSISSALNNLTQQQSIINTQLQEIKSDIMVIKEIIKSVKPDFNLTNMTVTVTNSFSGFLINCKISPSFMVSWQVEISRNPLNDDYEDIYIGGDYLDYDEYMNNSYISGGGTLDKTHQFLPNSQNVIIYSITTNSNPLYIEKWQLASKGAKTGDVLYLRVRAVSVDGVKSDWVTTEFTFRVQLDIAMEAEDFTTILTKIVR